VLEALATEAPGKSPWVHHFAVARPVMNDALATFIAVALQSGYVPANTVGVTPGAPQAESAPSVQGVLDTLTIGASGVSALGVPLRLMSFLCQNDLSALRIGGWGIPDRI
jgi:hypothetical protein